eukprot:15548-Heterococcus_DN1.PRE.3
MVMQGSPMFATSGSNCDGIDTTWCLISLEGIRKTIIPLPKTALYVHIIVATLKCSVTGSLYGSKEVGPSSTGGCSTTSIRLIDALGNEFEGACLTSTLAPTEGWGVALDDDNLYNEGPGSSVRRSTSSTAETISTSPFGNIEVTHTFTPSPLTDYAYQVDVAIKNAGTLPVNKVFYRRVIDWNVEPTAPSGYVTIEANSPAPSSLVYTSSRFESTQAFTSGTSDVTSRFFNDRGPGDFGATFDFDLGSLAAGDTVRSFHSPCAHLTCISTASVHEHRESMKLLKLFYGAAPSGSEALQALVSVGAEVYTTARSSANADGSPVTFFLGYSGVGGSSECACACA